MLTSSVSMHYAIAFTDVNMRLLGTTKPVSCTNLLVGWLITETAKTPCASKRTPEKSH
jgi:hypothetical protein